MKHLNLVSFAVALLMCLTSCYGSVSSSSYSGGDEEETVEVKEAEKKPMAFYQRLLEEFCQRYYDGCFKGHEYHYNSLIAEQISVVQGNWENGNIISWEMKIKGRHSFEGRLKNYNDEPFEAFVDDLGNDSYKVLFCVKKRNLLGMEKDEWEEATRTMTYSE